MKDNDPKLDKLLRGARDVPDFVPPKNFADQVMSKVTSCSTNNLIMIDFIMPKIVWAAALVLAVFLTSEVIMNINGLPSLKAGVEKLANTWYLEFDTVIKQ